LNQENWSFGGALGPNIFDVRDCIFGGFPNRSSNAGVEVMVLSGCYPSRYKGPREYSLSPYNNQLPRQHDEEFGRTVGVPQRFCRLRILSATYYVTWPLQPRLLSCRPDSSVRSHDSHRARVAAPKKYAKKLYILSCPSWYTGMNARRCDVWILRLTFRRSHQFQPCTSND